MSNESPPWSPSPGFWKVLDHLQGTKHEADRTHPNYVESFLLVFVHGVLSTHESTWMRPQSWLRGRPAVDFPQQLLLQLGVDLDILNFRYPSRWCQEANESDAAEKLATCLSSHFQSHRNIVFITHSNGGIVLKRFLADGFALSVEQLDRVITPAGDFDPKLAMHTPWGRTRGIINFDVPHFGGAKWLTDIGAAGTSLLGPVLRKFQKVREALKLNERLGINAPVWGWNKIFRELKPTDVELKKLHRDHLAQLTGLADKQYPAPAVRDVIANEPGVILLPKQDVRKVDAAGRVVWKDQDGRIYQSLPGNHSSVKVPSGFDQSSLLNLLAGSSEASERAIPESGWLGGLRDWRSVTAAELLLRRLICDRLIRADRPIGQPVDVTTQAGLLADTVSRIERSQTRVQVVGPPGVGKSTVLRLLARRYGVEYLANWYDRNRRLPLFLQLRDPVFASVRPPRSVRSANPGRLLLLRIARAWCKQANALHADGDSFTVGWFVRRLRDPALRSVIVVDSIDEFLAQPRHRDLTLEDIASAFGELNRVFADSPNVAVVAATRISIGPGDPSASTRERVEGLDLLGKGQPTAPLWEMSEEDCQISFPKVGALLDRVEENVRRMLLTPLFARIFNETPTPDKLAEMLTSPTETFRGALDELYRHSGLRDSEKFEQHPPTGSAWTSALAVVAWWMLVKLRPSLPVPPETETGGDFWGELDSMHVPALLASGVGILKDRQLRDLLLSRTILRPVTTAKGMDEYVVYHKEFEDFLRAWYLAACIGVGQFGDLASRALNTQIFTVAGELLQTRGVVIDQTLVRQIVKESRDRNHWFVFGNVGAVIGNSFLALQPTAVPELLEVLLPPAHAGGHPVSEIDPTVRIIMLANWARRALRCADPKTANKDLGAKILLNGLTADAPGGLAGYAASEAFDPLTRSVAASYLREFADRCGTALPKPPPGSGFLDGTSAVVKKCAAFLDPKQGDKRLTPEQYQTLEQGWCRVVLSIRMEDDRVIDGDRAVMAVHYLFALAAVVRANGSQDADTPRVVREALATASPVAALMAIRKKARSDDELARIFDEARKV
ncbi:ATP-binding protein [Gemmata sp. G18]|uniref:ATP-binding protein n=1 Tax=Gemmata palustris TaxID=2822762 RepID=A0ABS5BVZ2_9BACT|nr:ATP-binding protein [Gemmata palustris]MBP3957866.1 ATP-binding protein [Gemmata palustris]